MKKLTALAALLISGLTPGVTTVTAQVLDFPIYLAASNAELRPNHFHSGIDLKTQGVTGKTVRSVADGYVSRISIGPGGFGKAVYITHTDGTSSVYGHLEGFTAEIDKYVRDQQYARESFRVELYPTKTQFPVKKGDMIAISGNTGSSAGPHVHFETRDAASTPWNPLVNGTFKVADTIPPRAVKFYWISVEYAGAIPIHTIRHKLEVSADGSSLSLPTGVLEVGREGYIALEISEKKNGTDNYMGAYIINASRDGNQFFGIKIDGIPFSQTRYVNAVTLPEADASRNGVYRLCVLPNNPLRIYNNTVNKGMILLDDNDTHRIDVDIHDDCGNRSRLSFSVRKRDNIWEAPKPQGEPMIWSHSHSYKHDGLRVSIPSSALYESIVFRSEMRPAPSYAYSPLYNVHDANVLLQKSITVSIDASSLPADLRSKALLGKISPAGRRSSAGGAWKSAEGFDSGVVETTSTTFGRFYIAVDDTPPKLTPQFKEGEDLSSKQTLVVNVTDDFSGVESYIATIDGKWALMEYDPKTTRLIHRFDDTRFEKGKTHQITVTASDAKGNKTTFTGSYNW